MPYAEVEYSPRIPKIIYTYGLLDFNKGSCMYSNISETKLFIEM